jgi:hypothetical protein
MPYEDLFDNDEFKEEASCTYSDNYDCSTCRVLNECIQMQTDPDQPEKF